MQMVNPQNTPGARLEYVVVPLEGEVTRKHRKWEPGKGFYDEDVLEPAGFLVFFPKGHNLRLKTLDELEFYGLTNDPRFANMTGLHDPNSAIGKLLTESEPLARQAAYRELEKLTIRLSTAKNKNIMPELETGEIQIDGLNKGSPIETQQPMKAPSMLNEHLSRGRRGRRAREEQADA